MTYYFSDLEHHFMESNCLVTVRKQISANMGISKLSILFQMLILF